MSNPANPAAPGVHPVSAGTQEVRFATAMTGGVSLAIWMGGVAREMNLLEQASRAREGSTTAGAAGTDALVRDRYQQLLGILDVTVAIDVLSGTSAGGINAALLGVCSARGVDLGPLRDIWLNTGAFDRLLRDPALSAPSSLLQGDGVLLNGLVDGLTTLTDQATDGAPPLPTKVFVTTTLLSAETSRFTDDYGTLVPDVDHNGLFTFDDADFTNALGAVALAARASASFPGAFEPAFIPYDEKATATEGPKERPAMAEYANTTRPHWVADGGILANRPIGQLLQAVFDAPALGRQVRRILLYVVPDPGGTPTPAAVPPEDAIDKPLLLGEALRKDFGAALNHSISADLRAIRQHNDRVYGRADARLRLAELAGTYCGGRLVTPASWIEYSSRESDRLARPVVGSMMKAITTVAVPDAWAADLAPGAKPEEDCRKKAAASISKAWKSPPFEEYADFATLGRSAFEGARITVLGLLRMAYPLAQTQPQREMLANLSQQVHATFVAQKAGDLDRGVFVKVCAAATQDPPPSLGDLAEQLATGQVADSATGDCRSPGVPTAIPAGLAQGWWALSELVSTATPQLQALIAACAGAAGAGGCAPDSATAGQVRAAQHVKTYITYLGTDRDGIAARLLNLYVAERAMLPVDDDVDQPVELIQVSANTRTLLDLARSDAADKLTGTQLHHFGAFYKSSWRANDWMWGRLDGAGWLVHVLLDPKRIEPLYRKSDDPNTGKDGFKHLLTAVAGGPVPDISLGKSSDGSPIRLIDAVDKELEFLDDVNKEIPVSLPSTALWVARSLQVAIAAQELPVVAQQMLSQPGRKDGSWPLDVLKAAGTAHTAIAASQAAMTAMGAGRSAKSAATLVSAAAAAQETAAGQLTGGAAAGAAAAAGDPAKVAALLPSDPVPAETFQDELGAPLLTRIVAKAVAVLAAMVPAAVANPPSSIKPLFSGARTVTLTGYKAVDVTGTSSRRMILGGLGLAGAGFVLASRHSTILGFTGSVMMLVGLYLVALGAWSFKRGLLAALGAATAIVAVVVLCLPFVRDALLGTTAKPNDGWLVTTLLPWVRRSWWGLLAVLGAVLLLSAGWSFALRIIRAKKVASPSSSPR